MVTMIELRRTSEIPLEHLIKELAEVGYQRVELVAVPGQCAIRGGILDIFPVNQTHPIRLEFDDDHIERLCSFDPRTQRTIRQIDETKIAPNDFEYYHAEAPEWVSGTDRCQVDLNWTVGDFVVHEDFGVGRFDGLHRLQTGDHEGEFMRVLYRGQDKLYVPIDKMDRLTRYQYGDLIPRLNGLSDGSWKKTKEKCEKAMKVLAEDIYLMMKVRQQKKGISFQEDTIWQLEMEHQFAHEPTADQIQAIDAIKNEMEADTIMDRLICGEVGYGKTEVLVRAAFKAIQSDKQVAVLVPTTLLAQQHQRTFESRFQSFGISVGILSRFQTRKEIRATLSDLKENRCKVVIGTHRLIQKDVEFADLGLVIIDEEQRFGVRQKEALKQWRKNVDIISVSATPIPRTLYLALSGTKKMSRIETAPHQKKMVRTRVDRYQDNWVCQHIERECARDGQIFYLVQRIDRIPATVARLNRLMPEIKIGVVHGSLNEKDLLQTMTQFVQGEIQLLVCTTIIENGIDIPNANTIIVEESEQLGLSQLHQIRGRVGRSDRQAYAYLSYSNKPLSDIQKKRIQAIQSYTGLGAGYILARKDLEIRGAGSLLGEKQHGHMTAIGFDLYCKLLADSVAKIQTPQAPTVCPFRLGHLQKAFIPKTYIPSETQRLAMYQRLVSCKNVIEWNDLRSECIDRYGPLPERMQTLIQTLKQQLDTWKISQ